MLTFFDYLRQRAFEAVVAGVNGAFEYLDSHKTFDIPKLLKPQSNRSVEAHSANERPDRNSHPTSQRDAANRTDSETPLPPRKRGRPKKSGGDNA